MRQKEETRGGEPVEEKIYTTSKVISYHTASISATWDNKKRKHQTHKHRANICMHVTINKQDVQ